MGQVLQGYNMRWPPADIHYSWSRNIFRWDLQIELWVCVQENARSQKKMQSKSVWRAVPLRYGVPYTLAAHSQSAVPQTIRPRIHM